MHLFWEPQNKPTNEEIKSKLQGANKLYIQAGLAQTNGKSEGQCNSECG